MSESAERNVHQELVVAIVKAGVPFDLPGGLKTETAQEYLVRLAVAVGELNDDAWNAIPEWAQAWYDDAAKIINGTWYDMAGNLLPNRQLLPICPGLTGVQFVEPPRMKPTRTVLVVTGVTLMAAAGAGQPAYPRPIPIPSRATSAPAQASVEVKLAPPDRQNQPRNGVVGEELGNYPAPPPRPSLGAAKAALPTHVLEHAPPTKPPPLSPKETAAEAAFAILAEHYSVVKGRLSAEDLQQAVSVRISRNVPMRKLRPVRTAFYIAIDALSTAGKLR